MNARKEINEEGGVFLKPNRYATLYIIIAVISLLLVVITYNIAKKPVARHPSVGKLTTSQTELMFDNYSVYQYLSQFEKNFPHRTQGHDHSREAATWFRSRFFEFRLPYYTQKIPFTAGGQDAAALENVYAVSTGTLYPGEYIIVLTHYDNPETTHALTASLNHIGVAVNTELARIFAAEPHNRSILFLFTAARNSKEKEGAVQFIRNFSQTEKLKAVLVLDIAPAPTANHATHETADFYPAGLRSGYTPLWLRETARLASEPYMNVKSYNTLQESAIRSFQLTNSEAGVFLKEGIPAISFRWLGAGTNASPEKNAKNDGTAITAPPSVNIITLGNYGKAVEKTIRTLDEPEKLPSSTSYYLKTSENYLSRFYIALIHLIFFVPMSFALYHGYRRLTRINGYREMLKRESLRCLNIFGAATAAYLLLRLMPLTGMATPYPDFYLTESALRSSGISVISLVLILAVAPVAVYSALKQLLRKNALPLTWDWEAAQLFILIAAAAIYTISLFTGAQLWTAALLLPSLYLWPLIKEGRERWNRYINLILVIPGIIFYLIFLYSFSNALAVRPLSGYLIAATTYGYICPFKILLLIATTTIYIMATTVAWHSSPPQTINEAGLNR